MSNNHTFENCFLNPASQKFRKGIHTIRCAELKRAGKEIPDLMKLPEEKKEELPPPPTENKMDR
jgi:hypothetical protein